MSFTEFDVSKIKECQKIYANEAKELYGSTETYLEYQQKTSKYDDNKLQDINEEMNQIFKQFANVIEENPDCDEAQNLVKKWQVHITKYFYECTDEILSGLGQMYVQDERFKKSIDKHHDGLAEFISNAIKCYCEQK